MLPKTKSGELKHRKHKRALEISLAIEALSTMAPKDGLPEHGDINVLEFGSGKGFQIRYLQALGNLIASDLRASNENKDIAGTAFVQCDITNAPFKESQFNIVFSNHVIEHIQDTRSAFSELKRIGKPGCIYAFAVPTNMWLLISVPAQYYGRMIGIAQWLLSVLLRKKGAGAADDNWAGKKSSDRSPKEVRGKGWQKVLPRGHGVWSGFLDCYGSFRINKWRQLFSEGGFSIMKVQPLLLYGPSQWPIIPTTTLFNRLNVCSSVLFLMKRAR